MRRGASVLEHAMNSGCNSAVNSQSLTPAITADIGLSGPENACIASALSMAHSPVAHVGTIFKANDQDT